MTPQKSTTPVHEQFRLDGKVAIVTGVSSGLGERFARVLHGAGATVVGVARRADRLEQLRSELGIDVRVADLADEIQRLRVVAETAEHHGRIDVLVNNAGMVSGSPAAAEATERYREVLELNLVAPHDLACAVAPTMRAGGGGSVINIASIWGMVGIGTIPDAGYAASKGGLVNLTRELSAQWAATGIRVNAIAPGWFRSEMTADTMFEDARGRAWVERNTPMRRAGMEHELDGALLFLASPASSYVTGIVLPVDGGWTSV